MSKGPYEAVSIKDVDIEYVAQRFDYERLQVGFDVAKEVHFACLMGPNQEEYYVFYFDARRDLDRMIAFLEGLEADEIRCTMEATGTYGEPLRAGLERHGFEVHQMGAKKCQQAQELFDDVPSLHDGKAAYLLARLSWLELAEKWEARSRRDRRLRAILGELHHHEDTLDRLTGRMEGQLAQFWPELTVELDLRSATLQKLLAEYGCPQAVAADPEGARGVMHRASRGRLGARRMEAVLQAARQTTGVEPIGREVEQIQHLAREMRQAEAERRRCRRQLDEVIDQEEQDADQEGSEIGRLRNFGGVKLASVLVGKLGAPSEYESAAAYEKAAGLNLREKSSGQHHGEPSVTKQGPGSVRHNLFMLACRMVQSGDKGCPYLRAWYHERLRRNGGVRLKGLVAVMRKLIRAIYHIGRGAAYDPCKLFDVSRLDVPVAEQTR